MITQKLSFESRVLIGLFLLGIFQVFHTQDKNAIELNVGDCIGGTSVGEIVKIYKIGTNTVSTRNPDRDVIFNKKSLLKTLNNTSKGVYIYKCDNNMDEL